MPRQAGFTLIEILVVVLIIGVLVTFATLSIGDRALVDKLDSEVQRLEQLFRLAQEEAELKGVELGFRHTDERYQFLAIGPEGSWVPIGDGPLRERAIPAPLSLSLRVEGRAVPPAQEVQENQLVEPQVLILSSGELNEFSLEISAAGLSVHYRIDGNLLGRIERRRVESDHPS